MAEENKTIIIQVKVSEEEVEKKIVAIRKELSALKDEKTAVERAFKQGSLSNDQYEKSLEGIDRQQKALNVELRGSRKTLQDYATAQKTLDGSLVQLRANLRQAVVSYDNLSKAERESAEGGQALQKEIKALSDELGAAEAATGRFQRNVGNYSGAIEPLIQELVKLQEAQKIVDASSPEFQTAKREIIGFQQQINQAGAAMGQTYDQVQAKISTYGESIRTTTAELVKMEAEQEQLAETGGEAYNKIGFEITALKNKLAEVPAENKGVVDSLNELDGVTGAFGGQIEALQGYLGKAKTGLEAAKLGLTGLKGAIAATGIGLLLIALTTLATYLTKTKAGMEFVEKATRAVGAVMGLVTDKVAAVGEGLFNAFTNPKKALTDLVDFIETNLLNRLRSFAVILDGITSRDFSKIGDGFFQMATGVTDATGKLKKFGQEAVDVVNKTQALADANEALEDSERALNVQRAKSNMEISRLKFISADATKNINERVKAAKQAFAIENSIAQKEIAIQKQRIGLIQQEGKLSGDVDSTKLSEAQVKLSELRTKSLDEQRKNNKEVNELVRTAMLQQAQYLVNQAEQALVVAKKKGLNTISIEKEILDRQLVLIQARAEAEKKAITATIGAETERQLIQAKADAEKLEAAIETAKKISEITYKAKSAEIESALALAQKGAKAELDARIEGIETERNKRQSAVKVESDQLAAKLKSRLISQKEFNEANELLVEENTAIVLTAQRAIEDARKDFDRAEVVRQGEIVNRRLQTELDLGDQTIANDRRVAEERIDLEEETQLKLLKLEEIGDLERLNKQNAIQSKAIAARKELATQRKKDELDTEQAILDQKLALTRDGSLKELKLQREQLEIKRKEAILAAKKEKEQVAAINAQFDEQQLNLSRDIFEKQADEIIESAGRATATLSKLTEGSILRQTNALDDQEKAVLSSAALTADQRAIIEEKFQKKRERLEKEAAEKRRKIASIENVINTAQAVTKAYAVGGPLGAIFAAIAVAQGIAQQIIIDNQKFATGGVAGYRSDGKGAYITGPGTGKSDSINARISNGEAIINAASTRKHYATLSAINVEGGGRPFPMMGPQTIYRDREVLRGFSAGGVQMAYDTAMIAKAVREGFYGANIAVAVTDIRSVESDMKYVEAEGSF